MSYLKAQDTVSGKEGKAVATIRAETCEDMFYIKKIEANVERAQIGNKKSGQARNTAQGNGMERRRKYGCSIILPQTSES